MSRVAESGTTQQEFEHRGCEHDVDGLNLVLNLVLRLVVLAVRPCPRLWIGAGGLSICNELSVGPVSG